MHPRAALLVAASLIMLIGITAAWWVAGARRSIEPGAEAAASSPAPPVPANFDLIDGEIADLVRRAVAQVTAGPDDPDRWRALGVVYDANDLDVEAAACYERAVALRPSDGVGWYHLAVVRDGLGSSAPAIEAMRRAVDLAPTYAPARWRLGFMLLDAGDPDAAEAAFRAATRLDPEDDTAWIGLARTQLRQGADRAALDILMRLTSSGSVHEAYADHLAATALRRLGRADEAESAALRGSGAPFTLTDPWRDEVDRARAGLTWRILEAAALVAAGRADEGIALMETLQGRHPDEVAILTALGSSYTSVDRHDDAVRVLESALEIRPSYYPAHLTLARALTAKAALPGAPDVEALRLDALEHVDRALALNPTLSQAHGLRGDLMMTRQDYTEAAASYGEAARAAGADTRWLSRAALAHMRAEQWAEAVAALTVVTRRDPEAAMAHRLLGVAQMQLGDLDAAEATLHRAVELDPMDPALNAALAELRRRRSGQ